MEDGAVVLVEVLEQLDQALPDRGRELRIAARSLVHYYYTGYDMKIIYEVG